MTAKKGSTRAWRRTLEAFGQQCAFCHASGVLLTRDHWVPVSMGGLGVLGNLVPACEPCNSAKADRHPDDLNIDSAIKLGIEQRLADLAVIQRARRQARNTRRAFGNLSEAG